MQHFFFGVIPVFNSSVLTVKANGSLGALIWARMSHFLLNGECLPLLWFTHHDEKLITARHLNKIVL